MDYIDLDKETVECFAPVTKTVTPPQLSKEQVTLDDFKEKENTPNKTAKKKIDFEKYRIKSNSNIKPEEPVVFINDKKFAVKGDISFITGQPKAGKTSIATYILATSFMKEVPKDLDTLQIRSTYHNQKNVIYIDTEQPKSQTNRLGKRICRVLNTNDIPDNLHLYNFRDVARKDKKDYVNDLIDKFKQDIHFIVIDGLADLVTDPNVADESFDLIDDLMRKALEYDISILAYIHLNPNSEKVRGHMGSEAERKCGGMVVIKKDKDQVHSIDSKYMRYDANIDTVTFIYDTEKQDFRSLNATENSNAKAKKEIEKHLELYSWVHGLFTGGNTTFRHKDLINAFMQGQGVSDKTAKNRIKTALDLGFIEKDTEGEYSFIDNPRYTETLLFVKNDT
jgi:hypothetical protein